MKKIVILFLILASLCSFYMTFQQTDHTEFEKIDNLEKQIAYKFTIPNHLLLADPEEIYPFLVEIAKAYKVNIFRPSLHHKEDQTVEIVKYILLTNDTTFFHHIKLKSGQVLSAEETQEGEHFLTTKNTHQKLQKGQIQSFRGKHLITIHPLKKSYDYLPVDGHYFVEASNEQTFNDFIATFADKINQYYAEYGADYTRDDFVVDDHQSQAETTASIDHLTMIYSVILVILLLLMIYYVFTISKNIGTMKMHGLSNFHIWWLIVGRLIVITFVVLTIITTACGLLVENTTFRFVFRVIFNQFFTYFAIAILSLGAYIYTAKISISQAIKNRKDTNGILALNLLLKIVCSVILVLIGLNIFKEYVVLTEKQASLKNWEQSKDYGIFYPLYIGHDHDDDSLLRYRAAFSSELYPVLNQMGSIFIDAREYEALSLSLNRNYDGIFSIRVNNNYLQAYPVYDEHHVPISVSEENEDLILLVPEKYRHREKEIRTFFENEGRSRMEFAEQQLQLEIPDYVDDQALDIIWTANDQEIFSFNPDVFPDQHQMIIDPIIEVLTEKNDLIKDFAALGNGSRDAMKVKLIDRDPALTYKTLKPTLERLKIDDNLKYLVTIDQYILEEIYHLKKYLKLLLIVGVAILTGLLILIVQNLIVFFNKHQQKYVVNRLFGIGFFRTYKNYMMLLLSTWIVQLIICAIVNGSVGYELFSVAALFMIMEFIASIIALIIIERRNKLKVIKGG
ncbi:DUF1430 domain-containing protein [Bacillus chungangensis]|uniref:Bacteriocin-associated integral membrane protein n=1 Tax=Bacillus chungangensis TaxID=587633 RepID=A0ABT9WS39_9BACI|nr:DUF1430 domain-containing protein [Bacillus chungangensis]MDQ0176113.1 bacteriocin-associated integral membrane protein [Bacillus chungangensis]